MKARVIMLVAGVLLLTCPAQGAVFTMDFSNTTYNIGRGTDIELNDQYLDFGLSFESTWRYHTRFDPFDTYCISGGDLLTMDEPILESPVEIGTTSLPTRIFFSERTDFIEFDHFMVRAGASIELTAFNEDGQAIAAYSGSGTGTGRIDASGISYLEFGSSGGGAGISALSYERTEPSAIPEPATMLMLGLGLVGVYSFRRFMK